MTEQEVRHLSRIELLQLLREQEQEIATLHGQVEQLKCQLEDKRIALSKCGSIAEAAVKISGVLEAAQRAADLFTSSVMAREENP